MRIDFVHILFVFGRIVLSRQTSEKTRRMKNNIDVLEDYIVEHYPGILDRLLLDHTKNQYPKITEKNIVWATSSYLHLGKEYAPESPILPHLITSPNGKVVQPRAAKTRQEQLLRTKQKAEVFTPAWICNAQNNLVDNAWFGEGLENQFNTEISDHTWATNPEKIKFPEQKTWQNYVASTRVEITCGEAPYLVSRYDAVTGDIIPVTERIGLLDRKLRIVSENVDDASEWTKHAKAALKSIYGYEYQGDSLLIARESAFFTFIDFYQAKFHEEPPLKCLEAAAYIISWNLWQMDGLTNTIPYAQIQEATQGNLFEKPANKQYKPVYAQIRDWRKTREFQKEEFRNSLQK